MKRKRYHYTVQIRDDVVTDSQEDALELISGFHNLGDNDSIYINEVEELEDAP